MVLASGTLALGGRSVQAAEPPKPQAKKYIATVHTDEGEVEKPFDLRESAQAKELASLLAAGEVEELKRDKDINILAISWDLGLWTAVVFVLLVLVLRRWAWQPMLKGLNKRESNIREALAEAQRARDEAERLRRQLQEEMNHVQEKVRDILEQARRHAQQATDEMVARARADIQIERDRLHREIELARDQALHELWTQAAQLATLISAKAIRRQLTPDDHRRLVDEAIADLRRAGSEGHRELSGV